MNFVVFPLFNTVETPAFVLHLKFQAYYDLFQYFLLLLNCVYLYVNLKLVIILSYLPFSIAQFINFNLHTFNHLQVVLLFILKKLYLFFYRPLEAAVVLVHSDQHVVLVYYIVQLFIVAADHRSDLFVELVKLIDVQLL